MAIYLAYVGPPNATFGVCEQGQTYTDSVGNTWLCTVRGVAGQPGTTFLQIGEAAGAALVAGTVTATSISTTPPSSASVVVSVGTSLQNTTGSDAVLGAYVYITNASVATLGVGVGPAASPATAPIVSAWTSSVATVLPINVYVPNNYYFWMKVTSGSVASSTLGQWYPV